MGNRIFAVDMIINDFLRPMNQAYQFHDYRVACQLLFNLNAFLRPFSAGIKNLPDPTPPRDTLRDELKADERLRQYFEMYSDRVLLALGRGIKQELIKVIEENAQ